ncbi:MAG: 50S ribosomal protein L10 [Verrucomicrobia bacterium]|nr:50S ribosomal protein L10 [Verrucomicrobiota bacterium]
MRPEKINIVQDLQAKLNASPFVLVTDYTGLRVDQFSILRNRLADNGAECKVVKNTFLRRAMSDAGLPDIGSDLKGQTAIVIGEKDVAAAAKVLKTFVNEFKKPELKLGVVGSAVVTADQINAIADLPSREVLLGQLLGVMQAPASTLVRLLNEPASALARVLKAKADAAGEPAAETAAA